MLPIIVGTAGHIDHGKTALVGALTGIDTDRLAEEKRRGISIDLGFAHLDLEGAVGIGFVDVPGHERFIKNMLAGVGGIDLVLFVVAADESIKPQTREHFDICRLLGIERGIIALTKADLVDRDILDLVRLEVEEFVAGSFLEGAPIIGVSSVTGEGLPELREQLRRIAREVKLKDASRHFRLPVDRAFSMRGFGAVVTGTLIAGAVSLEQEVEIHPAGKRARVRGIQVHGSAVARAIAGQRTALNLAGIEGSDLARGMVLADPGKFRPARTVDCEFELLASAKPLKQRAPVHFHAGTAEIEAEIRLLESDAVQPGMRGLVRFLLRDPLLILPGDRFIVRMFSPVVTIGGGRVVDADPSPFTEQAVSVRGGRPARALSIGDRGLPRGQQVKPRRKQAAERLRQLAGADASGRVALLVRESGHGMGVAGLVARTGLLAGEIEQAVKTAPVLFLRSPQPWLVDRAWFSSKVARLGQVIAEFHRQNPLLPGMAKEELRSRELPDAPPFLVDALIESSKTMLAQGDIVRLASHKLALKQDEEQALAKIETAFEQAGLAVPATGEVLAKSGVEASRARSLLQILIRDRKLVRVGEELVYHQSAIQSLKGMLSARKGERFSVPVFKDWTGITRKYAIPLLEYLDRERVTRRDGDERVVL